MNAWIPDWYWPLDGWIIVAGALCATSAALIGNFLVLRKLSLLGDAISHAILPGLALAFLVTGSRHSWPMFVGAVIVGLITALFTQWIRTAGRVDEGASMGVVFTTLFALGLILIVQTADQVDIDPGCVLYGAIEFTPLDTVRLGTWEVPRVVLILSGICLLNGLAVFLFFKELTVTAFDPDLATSLGIPSAWMHYLLMVLVALTAVAAFESVGNILVVAMFVVPPAAALMMTDRLSTLIGLSVVIAIVGAVAGHLLAITVPTWMGFRSTSTAGMMAVAVGGLFLLSALLGPRHGVLVTWGRRLAMSRRILSEDIVGFLFRQEEKRPQLPVTWDVIAEGIVATGWFPRLVLWWEIRQGTLAKVGDRYQLTEAGRHKAQELVRSHRLWETWLAQELDLPNDRIHDKAEHLEHFTDRGLRTRLSDAVSSEEDPHGSPIPPEV